MTQQMYDAVDPANIPAGAQLVAGYTDGRYSNLDQIRARFPHAAVVKITVFAFDNTGDVLDVEKGDATPDQAPTWVLKRRHAGHPAPAVYCDQDTWPAVIAEFRKQGVPDPLWWIAHYDNIGTLDVGMWAKQYCSNNSYDLSIVPGPWPGVQNGTDMTPDDLLNAEIDCYGDQPPTRTVRDILGYQDFEHHAIQNGIAALGAQVATLNTAVEAIKKHLGV